MVIYDFIKKKPNPKFWKNLNKMKERSSVRSIQYSVLHVQTQGDAIAASKLARHYGAESLVYTVSGELEGGSINDRVVNTTR